MDMDAERRVQDLRVPDFHAHIKPEDLDDLGERDRRLLLAFSLIEQKLDFVIASLQSHNAHLRYVELEMIRQRRWQRKMGWKMTVVMSVALMIGTGLLGELCRVAIRNLTS